jgi:hypothetical protein
MQISVVNRDAGTTVNLNNVFLNGYTLGNFSGGVGGDGSSDWQDWTVTNYDFSRGFTLIGEIELAGAFTRPTFQRFTVLLFAAILTTGRRTVTNLLRTVQTLAPGHPSSYHRIFSRRRWFHWRLARGLAFRSPPVGGMRRSPPQSGGPVKSVPG